MGLSGCLGFGQPTTQLKLVTNGRGLYQVKVTQLIEANLTFASFSHRHLSLTSDGQPIPFFVEEDALFFFADDSQSRYSAERVFWLTGNESGVAMETAVTPPSPPHYPTIQQTISPNHRYESRAAPNVASPWFWAQIPTGQLVEIDFAYPHLAKGEQTISLTFWGLSDDPERNFDHDVDIYLNGTYLETAVWDGQNNTTFTQRIPATLLRQENRLTLDNTQPGAIDIFYLDTITIEGAASLTDNDTALLTSAGTLNLEDWATRPYLLDITHPNQPALRPAPTDGATHLLIPQSHVRTPIIERPTVWHPPEEPADFVIILGDATWETAVQPLIEARQQEGLSTHLISIQQIADHFGDGIATPTAIQHAIHSLRKDEDAKMYLLLIGDTSLDYWGDAAPQPAISIPSPFVSVTYGGETVSDARLGDLDEDGLVDVALGRWPVSSKAEVRLMVKKTLAAETAVYTTQPRTILDESEPTFTAVAQRLQLSTPPHANGNPLITTYIGHGSLQQWGQANLQTQLPKQQSPILLQFTCLTGLFAHPTNPSLSERLLLEPDGPANIVAATSLTLSAHQEPFARALLNALDDEKNGRLGDAFLSAQQALNPLQIGQQEIHDTFLLLGDPTSPILQQQK